MGNNAFDNERADKEMALRGRYHEAALEELSQIAWGGRPGRIGFIEGIAAYLHGIMENLNPYEYPSGGTYELALEALEDQMEDAFLIFKEDIPLWADETMRAKL